MEANEFPIQNWVNESLDKTIKGWYEGESVGIEFDIDDFKLEITEDIMETHNIELSEDDMCEFESDCHNAIDVYLGNLMVKGKCNHIEGTHWMIYIDEDYRNRLSPAQK